MSDKTLSFDKLVENVESIHAVTSSTAKGAVNQLLTVRNWAIGYYIVEFEQNGSDRAKYGSKVLSNLADRLRIKGLDRSRLNLCRLFYQRYPQICAMASHKFETDPEVLISRLSFSHIVEIMKLDDPLERSFMSSNAYRAFGALRNYVARFIPIYISGLESAKNRNCC